MTDKASECGLDAAQSRYFAEQLDHSNAEYWDRVGPVALDGKTVLEVGCGHGALSIDAARRGAKRVVGVDIDDARVAFAQTNLVRNYAQHSSVISFQLDAVENVKECFDVVISKDSFEHIEDLPAMMRTIADHLSCGGILVAGFSPLYFSPFGDHNGFLRGRVRIPWLPVLCAIEVSPSEVSAYGVFGAFPRRGCGVCPTGYSLSLPRTVERHGWNRLSTSA